jgi:hypothetical protein
MIVGVGGYDGTAGWFTNGSVTIGGAAMTAISGGDASTSAFMGAMFYKVLPPTGTQTFAWDLQGTNVPADGNYWVWAFYKGIDTASPIRDSDASQQAGNPHTSKTLTAIAGDLIVAFMWQFSTVESTITWTGATEVQALTRTVQTDGSWAHTSPSGNQTVSASASDNQDGGVAAIVLKAAGGGGGAKKRMLAGLLAQRALRV